MYILVDLLPVVHRGVYIIATDGLRKVEAVDNDMHMLPVGCGMHLIRHVEASAFGPVTVFRTVKNLPTMVDSSPAWASNGMVTHSRPSDSSQNSSEDAMPESEPHIWDTCSSPFTWRISYV